MQTEVRLRFCLRTFMIVMTAVSISFGLLSAHLRHKAMTVAKIESRGGVVLYDTAVPTPHRSFINRAAIDSPHIGPWVRQPVIIIFPHEVSVTDKDLRLVSRLGSVETVHLAARESSGVTSLNKVTELGLAYLERLPRLRQLSLCGAGVSEAAVAQFRLRRPKCYVAQRPGEPVLLVQR